ncbi:YeeE/YedE family protein [Oceanospirillum sanctuarii]|uniref:YeeE/YedE family protein n=1 Tax=Oceanospirillum sanctuarii TaxID=1434821 RepID=UPI000A3A35A5|nr:YeeE/YedE family protein [Oceanospirillum sanctuarii]
MNLKAIFASLFCGALFGTGLVVSGMTDPLKVQGFLDITANWQPALMWVMGGAVVVTAICFPLVLKRQQPVLTYRFHLPGMAPVDRRLLIGSGLFGIGWGLSGYCPGPALVTAAINASEAMIFIPAMLAGFWVAGSFCGECQPGTADQE